MTTQEKNIELKYIIDHYVRYNESLNTKGSVYLSINTIFLAGMVSGFLTLAEKFDLGLSSFLLFIVAVLCNGMSTLFTLFSVKSFIDGNGNKSKYSLFFLRELTGSSPNSFDKIMDELSEDKLSTHLLIQAKLLAAALKKKLNGLSAATWFIAAQVAAVIIFAILLFL